MLSRRFSLFVCLLWGLLDLEKRLVKADNIQEINHVTQVTRMLALTRAEPGYLDSKYSRSH